MRTAVPISEPVRRPVESAQPALAQEPPAQERAPHGLPASVPGRLLGLGAQRALMVGASDDVAEREADSVADGVVAAIRGGSPAPAADVHGHAPGCGCAVSRSLAPAPAVVGADGGALDETAEQTLQQARSGGSPLPAGVRGVMEQPLGADLSGVRVHTGAVARSLAEGMQAKAFTLGSDVFFRDGMPDVGSPDGQHLLAHELTHTLQQGAVRRAPLENLVQRKGDKKQKPPPLPGDIATNWMSASSAILTRRSPELKALDAAIAAWVKHGKAMPALVDANVDEINLILKTMKDWRATKGDKSVRADAYNKLQVFVADAATTATAKKVKKDADDQEAARLHALYKKMGAQASQYAGRLADVTVDRFLPSAQGTAAQAAVLPNTDRNDDGTLTDAALDEFDEMARNDTDEILEKARGFGLTYDSAMSPDEVKAVGDKAENKNKLTDRTAYPELANAGTADAGEQTETVRVAGTTLQVTYDSSDANLQERLACLRKAVRMINATRATVPPLRIYLPKFGRDITVGTDCSIRTGGKVADAQFLAPDFVLLSSMGTGNPKTDSLTGADGQQVLKFLSAELGAEDGLVHTIIHEIGHALHYTHARALFYDLNYSGFRGKAPSGRSWSDVATQDVSSYGSSPREMIAEVFVAAVTGKKQFKQEVWDMYLGLGGVDPGHTVRS